MSTRTTGRGEMFLAPEASRSGDQLYVKTSKRNFAVVYPFVSQEPWSQLVKLSKIKICSLAIRNVTQR